MARQHAELMNRAAYYRWSAMRGHVLAGGDPQTGRPRKADAWNHGSAAVIESRAAYIAMAHVCLARAAKVRP